jgi:hypothetical protein
MNNKKIITSTALTLCMLFMPQVVLGDHHGKRHGFFNELFKDSEWKKMKEMSPEERSAFKKERKEKWDAMSRDDKLAHIEQRRQQRLQKMEEAFNSMSNEDKVNYFNERYAETRTSIQEKWQNKSDDEKIEYVENKMSRKRGMEKGKGKGHGKWKK